MDFAAILKILGVFLLASVKYLFSFPYALVIGLDYHEAILSATIGAMVGFVFFYYVSEWINHHFRRLKPSLYRFLPNILIDWVRQYLKARQQRLAAYPRKKFTRLRRVIVFLKMRYGFWGIIITAPVLLSIPLGAFLLNRYYSRRKVFAYMMISILGWAAFFSVIVLLFPNLV